MLIFKKQSIVSILKKTCEKKTKPHNYVYPEKELEEMCHSTNNGLSFISSSKYPMYFPNFLKWEFITVEIRGNRLSSRVCVCVCVCVCVFFFFFKIKCVQASPPARVGFEDLGEGQWP